MEEVPVNFSYSVVFYFTYFVKQEEKKITWKQGVPANNKEKEVYTIARPKAFPCYTGQANLASAHELPSVQDLLI